MYISRSYLNKNKDVIFVFGDNNIRKGNGGAAKLRDLENTYGFITKKFPSNTLSSFYKPDEYQGLYTSEIDKLKKYIINNKHKTFLISKLGSNLANKFKIFEEIIEPNIKNDLSDLKNVKFLW